MVDCYNNYGKNSIIKFWYQYALIVDYELEEILEGLVDQHGVDLVVRMIGGVCEGKALRQAVW